MRWKGTLQSLRTSARRFERSGHPRQRDVERQNREYARMKTLEQTAHEVDVYINTL